MHHRSHDRGSLSRGVSVQRRGLCPEERSLSRGEISVQRRDLCPGGSLSRGSLSRESLSGGLCLRVSVWRSLSRGSLSGGRFLPVGVFVWGGLCLGGLCQGDSPH